MSIVAWVAIGLVVATAAGALVRGGDPGGSVATRLLGMTGGLVGGFLGAVLFDVDPAGFFDGRTWASAAVGAFGALGALRIATAPRARPPATSPRRAASQSRPMDGGSPGRSTTDALTREKL